MFMTKSIKKIFAEYFAPEMSARGFTNKHNVWVRKSGEIFQAIGTDRSCIRKFVSPYWINKTNEFHDYIDYEAKASLRLSCCQNIIFPMEYNPFSAPEKALEFFKEHLLDKLDAITDMDRYIQITATEFSPIDVSDYVLLLESYRRGSLDFAKTYINNAFQRIYDKEYQINLRVLKEDYEIIRSGQPFFFTDSYSMKDVMGGKVPMERSVYEAYMRGEDPSVEAKRRADQCIPRVKDVQFRLVQKALQTENYDYSEVLEYKAKNEAYMRELIKQEYGLEF